MKNKNKLYNNFSYSVYRYAPESFQLYFNNQQIKLSDSVRFEMGNIAITKSKDEVLKLIKKWVRKKSTLSIVPVNPVLSILSEDRKEYYHIGLAVDRYNINQKLDAYKWIKEAFNNGNFATKTTSAKLDANYKPYDVQEVVHNRRLGKTIKYVAA